MDKDEEWDIAFNQDREFLHENFNNIEVEVEESEVEKFKWTHQSILLFLDEYEKRSAKFRNPKIKKKDLWEEISLKMTHKGYFVGPDHLNKKMRNMKSTYLKIVDNNNTKTQTGRGRINWEYFQRFEDIFSSDKSIRPVNIISSLPSPESNTEVNEMIDNCSRPSSAASSSTSSTPPTKWKRLDMYRKRQLEMEAEKIEEIKKIRMQMEEHNLIEERKLEAFKTYLDKQN